MCFIQDCKLFNCFLTQYCFVAQYSSVAQYCSQRAVKHLRFVWSTNGTSALPQVTITIITIIIMIFPNINHQLHHPCVYQNPSDIRAPFHFPGGASAYKKVFWAFILLHLGGTLGRQKPFLWECPRCKVTRLKKKKPPLGNPRCKVTVPPPWGFLALGLSPPPARQNNHLRQITA